MSIKNELKKSIPENLNLTEKEKATIRYRVHQHNLAKRSFKPVFVSVLFIVIIGILILPNLQFFANENVASNPTLLSEPEQPLYNLTEEEKRALHEEYVRIVDEANQLKTGRQLGVVPIEEFEESYWVTVDQFEKRIQRIVEGDLERERELVETASSNLIAAVTNANGETTKGTVMDISGIYKEIEVTAKLKTQYNAEQKRHLFVGVDNISTELVFKNRGEWEQVSYDAKIVNDGQTYRISIEGIFTFMEHSYEKIFTIEFHCDPDGNIS